MRYRFEYQRPNKHNQSEWKINVVKAHELYILLNGFSFYKNVQTLKLISNEKKLRKSCICYSNFILQHLTFLILSKLEFSMKDSAKEKRKPHIQFSSGCICPYVSLSSACVNYSKAEKVLLRIYAAE